MKYSKLGNTGLAVSEIALGCEGFMKKTLDETKDMIALATREGVNFIDIYTSQPELRSHIGEAIRGCSDEVIIQGHLCTIWRDGQYKRTRKLEEVKEGFEDLLLRLQRDSIEIGMIHYVDSLSDLDVVLHGDVMRYALALKTDGKIKHIGMSSHNPLVALEAVKSGLIEVLMFSVNPCYDMLPASEDVDALWDDQNYDQKLINMDPDRERLYEVCQERGVGITVMKAFGGGDLLDDALSPAGKALRVAQCIHYALTRPAVASVMAGSHSKKELLECLAYETASYEEKDYAEAFASFPKISWEGHCMYCGHCAPCPRGIDVAMVTKFLNIAKAQGEVVETLREHYALMEHPASSCIACGACETRCPFGVKIIQNMKEAVSYFGK